jgi:uncharacterized protein YecE (DUF72 family)
MASILIGTSSWTDKTLIESGLFYPPETTTSEARLRYYADQFPIVEVDSSYYALPSVQNSILWVKRTPKEFVFDVKAFRLLTQHQTPLSAFPADIRGELPMTDKQNLYARDLPADIVDEIWGRFRESLMPLYKAGKLGVVLFQFPPWFVYRPSHLEYIAECAHRMDGYRIAIEFRNKSWLDERHREEVLSFERDHALVHVIADEPQGFASSIPAVWEVTSPGVAVVRLHGRNREAWEKKGLATSAERFNYLYPEDELRGLVEPVRGLAARTQEVHVLFNNCYRNNAPRNAIELRQLIEGQPKG